MRVGDVMTEDPIWVEATATLGEAARKLDETAVRHLPVLREGVVVGIVSDRDLRSALPDLGELARDPDRFAERLDTRVGEVMTTKVDMVDPDRDLRDVVDEMLEHHVGAVVVADPESSKLVGIVSYVDVLRVMRDDVWG